MTVRLNNQEYLWLVCRACNARCKLAKNRGTQVWVAYKVNGAYWIEDFLKRHSDCDLDLETTR